MMQDAPSPATLSRALLSGAVCLVMFGALSTVVWMVYSARVTASDAEASVALQSAQSEGLRRAAIQGATTKNERAALMALAIPAGGNAPFISSVEALGKTARVTASVSSVGAAASAGDAPGSLTLSVQFSGTYAQGLQFVRLIETMPTALSVGSLSLQYDTGNNWNGSLSLSVLSFDTP